MTIQPSAEQVKCAKGYIDKAHLVLCCNNQCTKWCNPEADESLTKDFALLLAKRESEASRIAAWAVSEKAKSLFGGWLRSEIGSPDAFAHHLNTFVSKYGPEPETPKL